jgi:hypothetical protein
MNRILRERMREAEENDNPQLREFTHNEYSISQDLETGRVTVTGPAGYSIHDSRPSMTGVIMSLDGTESIEDDHINARHLADVQDMYDEGLFDLPEKSE